MDKYNEKEVILHRDGPYVVQVCTIMDTVLEEKIAAYGIYNTITGVREAEARRYMNAVVLCEFLQHDPRKELMGTEQYELPLGGTH
jgi:glutamate formiminotransferase